MKLQKARAASLALGFVAALALSQARADSTPVKPKASIAFADHGAISDWQADRQKGLWVQANNRQWYYATFMAPCNGLNFANTIGFDSGPMGSLDRWGAVVVPRWGKCTFKTFEPSDGPPSKRANG